MGQYGGTTPSVEFCTHLSGTRHSSTILVVPHRSIVTHPDRHKTRTTTAWTCRGPWQKVLPCLRPLLSRCPFIIQKVIPISCHKPAAPLPLPQNPCSVTDPFLWLTGTAHLCDSSWTDFVGNRAIARRPGQHQTARDAFEALAAVIYQICVTSLCSWNTLRIRSCSGGTRRNLYSSAPVAVLLRAPIAYEMSHSYSLVHRFDLEKKTLP